MKRSFVTLAVCLLCGILLSAAALQAKPKAKKQPEPAQIKNVIVLIPDGCAPSVLSASRWYQMYQDNSRQNLQIDPYLCGMVKTHSSNAPIGDSAPTTSTYMTGQRTRTKYISMYPEQDPVNDIFPIDPARAFQPLATLLEGSRILQNKATGLVVTCYFPHATPADCAAHYYNRSAYQLLARQVVYNNVDVVIGGGTSYIDEELRGYLKSRGVALYEDDWAGLRSAQGDRIWGLFSPKDMPYDADRDPQKVPSLAEMTGKAIETLSRSEEGFFLMVEGSKVDYAAHANDVFGIITEFLAFDKAVGVAMDFARKDGQTLVVVVPDHCTGGLALGKLNSGYDVLPLARLIDPLLGYKHTVAWMKDALNSAPVDSIVPILQRASGLQITEADVQRIYHASDYSSSPLERRERNDLALDRVVSEILTAKTYFAFTSHGHVGDDVFLAAYHPGGKLPMGLHTGPELHAYIAEQVGLKDRLAPLTASIFARHQDVFAGLDIEITDDRAGKMVVKSDKHTMEIQGECSYVILDGQRKPLESVIVYVDRNKTFYLPQELRKML